MTTFEPGASDVLTHGLDCSPRSTALRASRPAPIITDGFDVLVHDVIAAITTWPWSSSVSVPSASVSGTTSRDAVGDLRAAGAAPARLGLAVVRRSRRSCAGGSEAGNDSSRLLVAPSVCGGSTRSVERHPERRPWTRSARRGPAAASGPRATARRRRGRARASRSRSASSASASCHRPCALRVRLDALDVLGRAAGELQVAQRLGVDREDRARRAELRRHVADRRPVGERQVGDPRRRRTRRTCRRRRARAASR